MVESTRPQLRLDASARRDTPQQVIGWIRHSARIANLAAAGATEVLPLFWIRLYGVLTDITDFVELTMGHVEEHSCMFPLARVGTDMGQLQATLARLRALYEEDELLFIEYRRHVECHPLQGKFRSRRPRMGGVGHVPSALLGGSVITAAEAEAAFQRVLVRYGFDEERTGVDFARRAAPPLRELEIVTDACLAFAR